MCSNQVKRDQGRVPFTHLLRRAVIGAQGDSKTNNERKHDTTESVGVARDILRSMERKTADHLKHSINISMVYQVKLLLIRLHLQSNNRLFSPTRNKSITCFFLLRFRVFGETVGASFVRIWLLLSYHRPPFLSQTCCCLAIGFRVAMGISCLLPIRCAHARMEARKKKGRRILIYFSLFFLASFFSLFFFVGRPAGE